MDTVPALQPATPLTGSLVHLSVADLLQTAELNRRSCRITLRQDGRVGSLWLRDGRVVDAEVVGGPTGREAVYQLALWETGDFVAEAGQFAVPDRIGESTMGLLLEAMRQRDEAVRALPPPHAALPDPPPAPPPGLLATHRALTLLNVAAAAAAEHFDRALLAHRLEATRAGRLAAHPVLAGFGVAAGGFVVARVDAAAAERVDPEVLAAGVGAWLRDLEVALEGALPGRFSLHRLRAATAAIGEDLAAFGFDRTLGHDEPQAQDIR